jgi:hypothetical protein
MALSKLQPQAGSGEEARTLVIAGYSGHSSEAVQTGECMHVVILQMSSVCFLFCCAGCILLEYQALLLIHV